MVNPVLFEALMDKVDDAELLPLLKQRIDSAQQGKYTVVDVDDI